MKRLAAAGDVDNTGADIASFFSPPRRHLRPVSPTVATPARPDSVDWLDSRSSYWLGPIHAGHA